jgi:hypothetical protein
MNDVKIKKKNINHHPNAESARACIGSQMPRIYPTDFNYKIN